MNRAGEVYENPVTGERAVIRVGTEESSGELLISDLYISPGGAVAGEHVHPSIEEIFTGGQPRAERRASGPVLRHPRARQPGSRPSHRPYSWNAGDEEAHVVVELRGDANLLEGFETMLSNIFGLAHDGKTDTKGRPNLLQAALLAREFDGVIRFVEPPRPVQKTLFGVLAPIAWLLGYRATYPEYGPSGVVEVEPWQAPEGTTNVR